MQPFIITITEQCFYPHSLSAASSMKSDFEAEKRITSPLIQVQFYSTGGYLIHHFAHSHGWLCGILVLFLTLITWLSVTPFVFQTNMPATRSECDVIQRASNGVYTFSSKIKRPDSMAKPIPFCIFCASFPTQYDGFYIISLKNVCGEMYFSVTKKTPTEREGERMAECMNVINSKYKYHAYLSLSNIRVCDILFYQLVLRLAYFLRKFHLMLWVVWSTFINARPNLIECLLFINKYAENSMLQLYSMKYY